MTPPTGLLGEARLWRAMVERFPWVEAQRGGEGEGLVHLELAALRRGAEAAADAQDTETVRAILGFVEELYRERPQLHPDVLNALDVSFVEDLYLSPPETRSFVSAHLGPETRVRWDEVARFHG